MILPTITLSLFLQSGPLDQVEPLGSYLPDSSFLDWSLLCGLLVTGALVLWVLGQVRETRRLRWSKSVAEAVKRRDLDELERLGKEAAREPWLVLWSDIVVNLREVLRLESHQKERVGVDPGHWRERFERSPSACIVLEGDRRISAVNPELCWLTGWSEEELVGRPFDELIEPEMLDARYAWAEVFVSSGEGTRSRVVRLVLADGSTLPALFLGRPVFDADGALLREHCVVFGLAGAPPGEPESDEQHGLEAMARLAGGVAHDFNDVLTTILGRGTLLQGRFGRDHEAQEDVVEILDAARSARQLTQQLLAMSRRRVFRDGLDARSLRRPRRSSAPAVEDATICIVEDDESVRDLVGDLLLREGYRVIVAASAEEALEACADSTREVDLLFADVCLPGRDGPALYRDLSERFEGMRVLFTSGLVDEEVFRSELPGFEFLPKPFTPHELLQRVRAILGGASSQERRRVLVVDDEASTRRLLQSLLESLDCDSIVAGDGQEALEMLAATHVDAVISDMCMPRMDGIQTCAAIHERFPGVKFIAMSGKSGGRSNLAAAEKLGAVSTLSKPFSKDELQLALQRAFGQQGPDDATHDAAA